MSDPTHHVHSENTNGWGDLPLENLSTICRILAGHINGLSLDKYANPKLQEIFTNMRHRLIIVSRNKYRL